MLQTTQTHTPQALDIHEAKHILQTLKPGTKTLTVELSGQYFTLPAGLIAMFHEILINAANGRSMSIIPLNAELTSQEAADHLGVSRQFLVQEADGGKIPFRKVGKHRRFAFTDILAYQSQMQQDSLEARQVLADQAQALNLDD
jgi:excisionase family DNA binding protein